MPKTMRRCYQLLRHRIQGVMTVLAFSCGSVNGNSE